MAGHFAIIGGGRMAHAATRILSQSPSAVRLWARRPEAGEALRDETPSLQLCANLSDAARGAAVVFFAIPTDGLPDVANAYGACATGDQIVLLSSRGVGPGFELPHQILRAKTCVRKIGILGGPVQARELDAGHSMNAVIATRFPEVVAGLRRMVEGTAVAIHASKDVIGLQVAGAISNVAGIAAGMAEAVEFGPTARAVLLAHGLVDARRLGTALGALPETFSGLAGLGELIPRHTSSTDRHVELGRQLGQGNTADEARAHIGGHIEGLRTALEAKSRGEALGIDLPLIEAVDAVLGGRLAAKQALDRVLHTGLDLDA